MISSDIHCKDNDVKTGAAHLISTFLAKNHTPVVRQAPCSPDIRIYRQKKSESSALLQSYRHFANNENPTRALNTTSLKCRMPSTDPIDKWEKITHSYKGSRSPHASALH